MKITTTVEITAQQIADEFCNAVESGESRGWCSLFDTDQPTDQYEQPWYADVKFYDRPDWELKISVQDDEDEEPVIHTINTTSVEKGLHLMAAQHSDHFNDLITKQSDAITSDIFLQLVVLGEVIYG